MTLLELKKELHKRIESLNDESYLEMLNDMIAHKEDVFIIPEHMKDGIREGSNDIKNGRFHTMKDFDKKYMEWLKNSRNLFRQGV